MCLGRDARVLADTHSDESLAKTGTLTALTNVVRPFAVLFWGYREFALELDFDGRAAYKNGKVSRFDLPIVGLNAPEGEGTTV